MRLLLINLLFVWMAAPSVMAQVADSQSVEDKRQVEITTMDWDVIRGTIIGQEDHAFVVETYGGIEMTIPFSEVREMVEIDGPRQKSRRTQGVPNDKAWFPNQHGYTYLFSGNYLPIPKQSGFIKNTYLTTNTMRFSFSERVSLGAGFEAISTVLLNPAVMIAPKVNIRLGDNWYAGLTVAYAGILYTWLDQTSGSGFGIAQLGTTVGTTERNFTVGTGWTLIGGELASAPFVSLGGMVRVSRRLAVVSDNFIAPLYDAQYRPILSLGLRYLGRNVSGEIIFVNLPELIQYIGPGLPVFSLSLALD